MNTATRRIAISRLVTLFIFARVEPISPAHLNSKYFAAKRPGARAINEQQAEAINKRSV
jgi:hypothetical protein